MPARIVHSESDGFVDLVGRAYQAAIDSSAWPTFLEKFADALHGENTALLTEDLRSRQNQAVACVRTDPEQLRLYNDCYSSLNPWIFKGSADLLDGRVAVGVGEMYLEANELVRTEFYNDWLRPQRLKHSIAAMAVQSSSQIIICSTLRSASVGPFCSKDIALYESLLPHLKRAMLTRERASEVLHTGKQAMEVLENSPNACLLVDRAFRPVFVNRAAHEILDGNCGLLLRDRTLLASRHEDTRRLRHLIERACSSPPSGGEMAIFREHGQPLLILVSPVQRRYEAPLPVQTVAALWLSDPNRTARSRAQHIRRLFGLTRAEASIAAELGQGLSLYEIADTLDISRHTARNHLKHIFEKMGAHRQTDVVRLVLSCPDAFGS